MIFVKNSFQFMKNYPSSHRSDQPEESEDSLKSSLLRLFCLITLGIGLAALIGLGANVLIAHEFLPASWLTITTATGIAFLNYGLAKADRYRLASSLLISILFIAVSVSYAQRGPGTPQLISFLLPIIVTVVLLDTRAVLIVMSLCISFNLLLHLFGDVTKWYVPSAPFDKSTLIIQDLFLTVAVIPGLVALIILPFRAQTRLLRTQNQRLVETLQALQARQQQSQTASQKVLELSGALRSNATQQASSSQEQVSTIAQINASMSQLSASAGQITDLAHNISSAMATMAASSQQIETTTQLSAQQSYQGSQAIALTILVSQQVAELYQKLTTTLENLNTKSADSRRILDLMASIAGETHLLALNASIEAAGTGEHGARFKMVAQEVKKLAQQAGQAGQEVVQVIEQIKAATYQAVKTVQEGYAKAKNLDQVVSEAGQVIEQMQQIAVEAKSQATQVNQFANQVTTLVEQIKLATLQQNSASHQVLKAVPGLSAVAVQNAQGSAYISSAAQNLEEMSHQLTTMLLL